MAVSAIVHIAEVTLLTCDVETAAARFAIVVVELSAIVRCVLFIISSVVEVVVILSFYY